MLKISRNPSCKCPDNGLSEAVRNLVLPVSGKFHTLFTIAVLMHLGPAIRVQAQFTFSEDFKNSSAPGWTLVTRNTSPGPRLTGGATADAADPETGTIDTVGDGWLRLSTTIGSQANAAYLDTVIPATNSTITVTFDFAMWEGSGADGVTFFMYDAAESFVEGAFGGSIGYAQKTLVSGGDESHPGLAAGYIGVGIDAFGNFSNATEGRIGGIGQTTNAVAVRGPGIQGDNPDTGPVETDEWYLGYAYQDGTTDAGATSLESIFSDDTNGGVMNFQSATSRPNQTDEFRSIRITLDNADLLKVEMQMGSGASPGTDFRQLFTTDYSTFTRPNDLRIGWAGGTGGANQVAEIRNLVVTATGTTGVWYWDNDLSTLLWGDSSTGSNFDPDTIPGTGLGAGETPDVVFDDQFVSSDQTISVESGDKTVNNVSFSGQYAYTLNSDTTEKLIFDKGTDTLNSIINILNNPNGNDDHTIATAIQLNNGLNIDHFVNQTLTLSGDVNLQTFDLVVESVGTTTISGIVSGSGDVEKDESGTLILSGANTFTGATTVTEGTIRIENSTALGGSGTGTTVNDGTTLAFANGISVASESVTVVGTGVGSNGAIRNISGANSWGGTVSLGGDTTFGSDAGTLTINGAISESTGSTFTKVGNGTIVLGANNTYTGTTTLSAGTVVADDAGALGGTGSGTTVATGATLSLQGSLTFDAEGLTLNGDGVGSNGALRNISGDNTWQGTAALNSDSSVGVDTGTTLDISGVVSGSNALTKIGDGSLTLSGSLANTASGTTTVNAGTVILNKTAGTDAIAGDLTIGDGSGTDVVRLSANNQINNSSNITLNGGELAMNGNTDTAGTLDLDATSPIDLASTSLLFLADSSGVAWDPAALLNFENWDGNINGDAADSGTDNIEFASAGLTTAQVRQSRFLNYDSGDGDGARTHLARFSRDDSDELVPVASNEFIWKKDVPGDTGTWDTDGNWLAEYYPDNTLARAVFGESTLDGNVTVTGNNGDTAFDLNRLTFRDTGGFDVTINTSAVSSLTFANDGVADPRIDVDTGETGDYTINSALVFNDDVTVDHAGTGTLDLTGVLSGASSVTKSGTGTLQLDAANTFTDGFTLSAGAVDVRNNSGFGTGTLTLAGGTVQSNADRNFSNNLNLSGNVKFSGPNGRDFQFTTNNVTGSANTVTLENTSGSGTMSLRLDGSGFSIANDFSLGANTRLRLFNTSGTQTFSGVISGAGRIHREDDGTTVLTRNNTYTGTTRVDPDATLNIRNDNALGSTTGSTTVNNRGTLELEGGVNVGNEAISIRGNGVGGAGALRSVSGTNSWTGDVTLTRNTRVSVVADDMTLSGAITASANRNLEKRGSGTLTLDGTTANAFGGQLRLFEGTVELGKTAGVDAADGNVRVGNSVGVAGSGDDVLRWLASNQVADTSELRIDRDGLADLNDFDEAVGDLRSAGVGGLLDLGSGTLTVNQTTARTVFLVISGTGGLTKNGAAKLELDGNALANTYTGTTTINEGQLELDKNNNVTAVNGKVVIGDGVGGTDADELFLSSTNQIVNTADITINSSGLLN